MSWLLFMDESGHDHKSMPLEVRGGVALHASKLWAFLQAWGRLEEDAFGARLYEFKSEAKGYKLLDKKRMQWANQAGPMDAAERRKHAKGFLQKGLNKATPTSSEFAAYGQACLEMARGIFDLLTTHNGKIFACAISRGTKQPENFKEAEHLRQDHVLLFERFYYFLEAEQQSGLLIMDESEKNLDRKFMNRMERYFTKTSTGRNRVDWIVPSPLFVASDMAQAVQAADICLYAINWGYRLESWGDGMETREEIANEFGPKLNKLQWNCELVRGDTTHHLYGIFHVADPYKNREVGVQEL